MKALTNPKDHQARHQPAELTEDRKVVHPPPHHYHAPPMLDKSSPPLFPHPNSSNVTTLGQMMLATAPMKRASKMAIVLRSGNAMSRMRSPAWFLLPNHPKWQMASVVGAEKVVQR